MNEKHFITNQIEYLKRQGFIVIQQELHRPWGGFFVIEENLANAFAKHFFVGVTADSLRIGGKLSPKILLVSPSLKTI